MPNERASHNNANASFGRLPSSSELDRASLGVHIKKPSLMVSGSSMRAESFFNAHPSPSSVTWVPASFMGVSVESSITPGSH